MKRVVVPPGGAFRTPGQLRNHPLKTVDQPNERVCPHRALGRCLAHILAGEAGLGTGVKVNMDQGPRTQVRSSRQQAAGQIQGDSVDMGTQQPLQPYVHPAHQQQGCQKMLAELTIGRPRPSLRESFKGKAVNENGAAASELHIVGAGIFEAHLVLQGDSLDFEREQGGVFELTETPLVGIRYEANPLRADDPIGLGGIEWGLVDLLVGNEHTVPDKPVVETRTHQLLIVRLEGPIDLAEQSTVALEEKPARVSEGAGECP